MTLIFEIILSVVFASGMMLYMGMHFVYNKKVGECEEKLFSDEKSDVSDTHTITVKTKNSIRSLSKSDVVKSFEILKERKLFWLFLVMIALSLGTWFYDIYYLEFPLLKSYINSVVFSLVMTMGYIDYKEHIIPNPLVLIGMGIWGAGSILEIFVGGTLWKDVLTFSLTGFGICGGLLLILAIVLRSGLGMGDVKMYAMLGLLYGLSNTYSLLICTVIPMAVVALVLLASKKVTKKSTLPMAPFTVLAFLVGILGGM